MSTEPTQSILRISLAILLLGEAAAIASPGSSALQNKLNHACGNVAGAPGQGAILTNYCVASATALQGVTVYEKINQSWNATATVCQNLCQSQGPNPISYDPSCDDTSYQSIDLDSTESQYFAGLTAASGTAAIQQSIAQQAVAEHKQFRSATACQEAQWATDRANARQATADDYRASFSSSISAIDTLEQSVHADGVSGEMAGAGSANGSDRSAGLADNVDSSGDGGRHPASASLGDLPAGGAADSMNAGTGVAAGKTPGTLVSAAVGAATGGMSKAGGVDKTAAGSISRLASQRADLGRADLLAAESGRLISEDGISPDSELSLFVRVTRRYVEEINRRSIY